MDLLLFLGLFRGKRTELGKKNFFITGKFMDVCVSHNLILILPIQIQEYRTFTEHFLYYILNSFFTHQESGYWRIQEMTELKYPIIGIYHITPMDFRKTVLSPILSPGNIKSFLHKLSPLSPFILQLCYLYIARLAIVHYSFS